MNVLMLVLLVLVGFGTSYWLVGIVRRYALAAEIVDLPNERTLHTGRVARGGGLAIVLLTLAVLVAATAWWEVPAGITWPLFIVTVLLGFLGWIDDHYDLPVAARILVQLLAAIVVVAWIGRISSVDFSDAWSLSLEMAAIPLTLFWVVWMANLYNFMDGIDGLAALQGMIGAAAMSLWFYWAGSSGMAMVCLVVFSACAGFLAWNWSPARVFMGDVGSVALGGLFAALSVVAMTRYDMPIIAFAILFIVFIADATLTLMRRIARGERFWQPHRSHYYQRAVQAGLSHSSVAAASGVLALVAAAVASLVVAGIISPAAGLAFTLLLVAAAVLFVIRLELTGAGH